MLDRNHPSDGSRITVIGHRDAHPRLLSRRRECGIVLTFRPLLGMASRAFGFWNDERRVVSIRLARTPSRAFVLGSKL